MSESNYKPSGELQGDTKAMPDRGTRTGMTGYNTHSEGKNLDTDAINRIGGISGSTKSNPAEQDCTCDDPAVGSHKGKMGGY
jgi:hypothetical protein